MNRLYISEGLLIVSVIGWIGCLITTRQDKKQISELKEEVDSMKKERIDDWVDAASDILEGQQDSIDRLEEEVYGGRFDNYYKSVLGMAERIDKLDGRFEDEIDKLNLHANGNHYAIDKLTEEVNEIKEILEKTSGVKFTSGGEE